VNPNVPNILTVARCFMALGYVVLMSFPNFWTALVAWALFTAAAVTDLLDGYFARKYNLISNFGKLMDPLADKILMAAAFIMMLQIPYLQIPAWAIVVIFFREYLVTGMRGLAASEGAVLAAISSGKLKTILQIVYCFVFMAAVVAVEYAQAVGGFAGLDDATLLTYVGWTSWVSILAVTLITVYSGTEFAWKNTAKLNLGK